MVKQIIWPLEFEYLPENDAYITRDNVYNSI